MHRKKEKIGLRELFSRVPRIKFFALLLVTMINSFVSLTFVAVTTLAEGLTNESTTIEIFLFCIKGIVLYIIIYFGMYLTEILINSIMKDFTLSLSMDCVRAFYKEHGGNEDTILATITQDVTMVRNDYYLPWLIIPTYVFRSLFPIVYLFSRNFFVGLLFTLGAAIMLIPQYVGKDRINKKGKELSDAREEALGVLTEVIRGKSMILNNEASGYFLTKFAHFLDWREAAERSLKNFRSLVYCLSGPLKGVADVLPFAVGIYLMGFDTRISLVLLLAMLATAEQLKDQFQQIIYLVGDISGTPEVRKKLGTILAEAGALPVLLSEKKKLIAFHALVLENLSKQYGERILFEGFQSRVPAGSKILFVGESGIGKSTLFRLLMGQEKPTKGTCYLERGNERIPLAGQVALIQQEPFLFKGTVRENITLGEPFEEQELLDVLQKVRFTSHGTENPLDIQVDKAGANLSGGEKARLEIARILLRKKPLILADEITANLDVENARLIRKILQESDATVIEIAHHYSDMVAYDALWEVRDHKIKERRFRDEDHH